MPHLDHQSGVNVAGEPFVRFIVDGKEIGQFTVQQAREHAMATLECAEAAQQDAFIYFFLQNRLGVSREDSVKFIGDFRQYREITTGNKSGPVKPEDWIKG